MKKVVFIMDTLTAGGLERRITQLIKGLTETDCGYKIYVITPGNTATTPEELSYNCDYLIFRDKRDLFNKIKKIQPDIIHCCSAVYSLVANVCKVLLRCKYIAGFVADSNRPALFSKKNIGFSLSYFFADAIVSNSNSGIQAYRCPKKKSHVVYNGFDPKRLNENEADDLKEIRKKYKFVISMVAVMRNDKDWRAFIDVAKVFEMYGDIIFLSVGGVKTDAQQLYSEEILNYSKGKKIRNILFLGHRNDVMSVFQISDVTLLLSNASIHKEGVSNSIMESMAAGTPVIATNTGGTPEIIENGVNGFIIDNNVNDVIPALNKLMSDEQLRIDMGKNCIKTVQERFLLDRMVNDYKSLYEQLLNKKI